MTLETFSMAALLTVLGLLLTIFGKVYSQGREMGAMTKTITVLEDEVRGLRAKAHHVSGEVQRLSGIADRAAMHLPTG